MKKTSYGGVIITNGKVNGQVEGTNIHMRALTKLANGELGIKAKGKWFSGNLPLERKVFNADYEIHEAINGYYVVKEGDVVAEHVTDYKKRLNYIQAYKVILIMGENVVMVPILN